MKEYSLTSDNLKERTQIISDFLDCFSGTEDSLKDYGNGDLISRTQIHLLSAINSMPGITATELSALKRRKKSTISQSLTILEKKGYLYRINDTQDAKKLKLYVTDEGKKLCNLHDAYDEKSLADRHWKLLQECTEEEIQNFYKVMSAYNRVMKKSLEL